MWLLIWLNAARFTLASFFFFFEIHPKTFVVSSLLSENITHFFSCALLSEICSGIKFYSLFGFYEVKVVHLVISPNIRYTSFIWEWKRKETTNALTVVDGIFGKSVAERYKFIDKQLKVTQSGQITRNCFFSANPCSQNHSFAILAIHLVSFETVISIFGRIQSSHNLANKGAHRESDAWKKKTYSEKRFVHFHVSFNVKNVRYFFPNKSIVKTIVKNRNGRFIGHFIIMNEACS